MFTKLLGALGTATDVRSIAAIVLGVLVTILGHNSVIVKAVVDGLAGILVIVDTYQQGKASQAAAARSASGAQRSSTPTP